MRQLARRNKQAFRCLANVAADSDETRRSVGREFQMTAQETAKSVVTARELIGLHQRRHVR